MKPEYEKWIAELRARMAVPCVVCNPDGPRRLFKGTCDGVHTEGYCHSAAEAMVAAFPGELRLVRGYAVTHEESVVPDWVKAARPDLQLEAASAHGHWWTVTIADGTVVDPTADQYNKYGGVKEYDEYDEAKHGPLPTGKCPECGDFIYDGKSLHDECESAYLSYLNTETRRR